MRVTRLTRSPITLQHLFLQDVTRPLGLLVSHLNDSVPVILGDADGKLRTSNLYCFDAWAGLSGYFAQTMERVRATRCQSGERRLVGS